METQRMAEIVTSAHLLTRSDVTRNRRWGYVDRELRHDVALDAALATITIIGGSIEQQTALDQNCILTRQVNARLKRAERTHRTDQAQIGFKEEVTMFDEHSAAELHEFLLFLVKRAKATLDQVFHSLPHHHQHALRSHYLEHHEVEHRLLRKAKHEFGRTAKRLIKVRLHLLQDHIQHEEERLVLRMILSMIEHDTLDEVFLIAEELD